MPPAQGERNAKGGLQAQDRLSAALVVKRLKDGTLRGIRVADPTAGRVDDFQILTEERADAYQVKWEVYPANISINDLLKKDDEKPCLISQLADGWTRIKVSKPDSLVVVHLVTNARPCANDRVLPKGSPKGAHLAAFMAECWKPLKSRLITWAQIPEKWTTWMAALEKKSGLSHDEFVKFMTDCDLDFDSQLESDTAQTPQEIARLSEIDEVAQFLLKTVASAERIVELSLDDLIRRLGWQDAATFRNVHGFPVDERSYQPVRQTEQSLAATIQQVISGYVCLLRVGEQINAKRPPNPVQEDKCPKLEFQNSVAHIH